MYHILKKIDKDTFKIVSPQEWGYNTWEEADKVRKILWDFDPQTLKALTVVKLDLNNLV